MPYPALPPTPPPETPALVCGQSDCLNSESNGLPVADRIAPEALQLRAESSSNDAIRKLPPTKVNTSQLPQPLGIFSLAESDKTKQLQNIPQDSLLKTPKSAIPHAEAAQSYVVTGGVSSQTNPREADLVRGMDQSLNLEAWREDFATVEPFIRDRIRQRKLAQTSQTSLGQSPSTGSDPVPLGDSKPVLTIPTSPSPTVPRLPGSQPAETKPPTAKPDGKNPDEEEPASGEVSGVLEVTADRQDYDEKHQVFTAEGKVLMRFQGALLDADRVQVNLVNRIAVAEGNVALTRGSQVLRGQRFVYNFVQGSGTVLNARGDIYIPSTGSDLAVPLGSDATQGSVIGRPVSDRVIANQPTQNVTNPGGISISVGAGRDVNRVPGALPQGGEIKRLRFEAERLDFTQRGWVAQKIQITNDPFSPPELVLKAERAKLTRISPLRDEVVATKPRLVFDQGFSVPVISRLVLDRRPRQPPLVRFGFDNGDRGGLFAEHTFEVIQSDSVRFSITPQYFLQRGLFNSKNPFELKNYGLKADLSANVTPRTFLKGFAEFTSLDPDDFENRVRASVRANQLIGTHTLAFEFSYRDRLFNNSLGFQTVQSSLGVLFFSPPIVLGKSGLIFSYQVGYQSINADTDRLSLLQPIRSNNRVTLSRFQAAAALSRGFILWQGKALPPTPTEGLRYTPVPIQPYVNLGVGITGVTSNYSNGDSQKNLIGSISLSGQFGHFSRPAFDYTAFNITYIQLVGTGLSPFLFDRSVDTRILAFGVTQQIYGPFRIGFQTALNLDTSQEISTDYILEYSRRTYGITVRYNPVLEIGSIGLRISDFNWTGGNEPFAGSGITPVEGGITRPRN